MGANVRVTLAKELDLGVHFLGGNGIGRYGTSGPSRCDCRTGWLIDAAKDLPDAGHFGVSFQREARRLCQYG